MGYYVIRLAWASETTEQSVIVQAANAEDAIAEAHTSVDWADDRYTETHGCEDETYVDWVLACDGLDEARAIRNESFDPEGCLAPDIRHQSHYARMLEYRMAGATMLDTLKLVEEQYAERGIELKEVTRAIARAQAAGLERKKQEVGV